ncbi:FadR/GntR family transcriptional regulator [Streptomyces uncialis]|uniref:FadR/GntR family transcriptional regulator n=1 Tax=Streptomyces uncialis TaxID=1048205 RepID=UPI003868EBB7|nr:FadR family transcriptional regulator [Streptomyces uncialis]
MTVDWTLIAPEAALGPDRLAGRLQGLIEEGRLPAGTRIPAERELAEQLRISRASVREALRELELRGLVDRKPGRGTIVTGTTRPDLHARQLGDMDEAARLVHEVMDLRSAVEPPVAARAALRATESDLQHLAGLLSQAELERGRDNLAALIELDGAFHVAVARATHNPMLTRLLEATNEWVGPSRDPQYQSTERLVASLRGHRRILAALISHDSEAAAEAMADHLSEVQGMIIDSLGRGAHDTAQPRP